MKPCLCLRSPKKKHFLTPAPSPSPWVTVARLQPRPVGPCKPGLERLAVWVTAPLPALSYKGVLTTLALLFGPQNTPQPPIWLFAEKERGKRRGAGWRRLFEGGGGGVMGSCWQCGVSMNSHKEVELVLRRKGVNGNGPVLTE